MVSKALFVPLLLLFPSVFAAVCEIQFQNFLNSNGSLLGAIKMPDHNFEATGCGLATSENNKESMIPVIKSDEARRTPNESLNEYQLVSDKKNKHAVKIHLKHLSNGEQKGRKLLVESSVKDLRRIQNFHRRIAENKNQNTTSRLGNKNHRYLLEQQASKEDDTGVFSGHLLGTLKSGVPYGSGEYFMDVFIGTPPKLFSLIVDTGSDLNWIQCVPCYDCFEQTGPHFNPEHSRSFQNITCHDARCHLVASPDPPRPCKAENQTCPYYYWYGDSSNTTGDFAVETFTVNLTTPEGKPKIGKVEKVMFGCGHWNRGLFHGAAGLLGLGRGPLSFASQLQSYYGQSFSYCLVDRNSGPGVSSKLIFGEDTDLLRHPDLNFTSLLVGKENPVDTFYYVEIESIVVGEDVLDIPKETWQLSRNGVGGTIIDSGTTLSYFAGPAYPAIKDAFVRKLKGYAVVNDFKVLDPCYNVSGVKKFEVPRFGIRFSDGAEWNFPVQNYFISVDKEVVCLAILGNPHTGFSIIGNYQQQNFHVLYDTKTWRLGFAPTRCADV